MMHTLCIIWDDGNEVVSNDFHDMAVDREHLDAFGTGVYQPKSVYLAGGEPELGGRGVAEALSSVTSSNGGTVEAVSAVDQVVVRLD